MLFLPQQAWMSPSVQFLTVPCPLSSSQASSEQTRALGFSSFSEQHGARHGCDRIKWSIESNVIASNVMESNDELNPFTWKLFNKGEF